MFGNNIDCLIKPPNIQNRSFFSYPLSDKTNLIQYLNIMDSTNCLSLRYQIMKKNSMRLPDCIGSTTFRPKYLTLHLPRC